MDFLIMVIVIFLAVWITAKSFLLIETAIEEEMAAEKKEEQDVYQNMKKQCPPHKWVYRKQPDSDEEYMVCELCGMLPTTYTQQID
jgi:hypothetical protein